MEAKTFANMEVEIIPVYVWQIEGVNRYYKATELNTGHYALGYSHNQAFRNLLGVLFLNNIGVYGERTKI